MRNGGGRTLSVGRDTELARLRERVDAATAGRGGLQLIAGEPGLGKSHLLDAVSHHAANQGLTVAAVGCWEGEGALPLWPWAEVLRQLETCSHLTDRELPRLLSDGAPVGGLLGDIDPVGARARLFDRVVTCLRTMAATEPLLVAIDDLHWADRSSLDLLAQLVAGSQSSPLLFVGAYRDTEVGAPLASFLGGLSANTERIVLAGLPPSAVAELASSTRGDEVDEGDAASLVDLTGGNPFFVKELVRLIAVSEPIGEPGQVPASVRDVLDRRLARLSPACHDALSAAAVIGTQFGADLLATVLDVKGSDAADWLDEALAARVIAESAVHRFQFVHQLFRQRLVEQLPRQRRLHLHLVIGSAIEARNVGDLNRRLGELAHHFVAAAPVGDPAVAADYCRRAARRAAATTAFGEAVDYLRQALDVHPGAPLDERADLLAELGDALRRTGELAGARDTLADALELARASNSGEVFARAAVSYGGHLGGNQPLASADQRLIALLDEALELLTVPTPMRCRVLSRLAVELSLTPDHARRLALAAEAVTMARRLNDPSCLAIALYAQQLAMFGPDHADERRRSADEIVGLATRVGDLELSFWGHLFRSWVDAEQCLPYDHELSVCARLADQLGLAGYRAEVAMRQAVHAAVAGQFDMVDRLVEVVREGQATDLTGGATLAALMALRAALQGPYDELAELVLALLADQPDKVMWRAALAEVYVELDRIDDARREFDMLAASGFDVPRDALWLFAMFCLGYVCFGLRDAPRAATLHAMLRTHVDQAPVGAFGSMATPVGLLDATCGRYDDALRWLDVGYERNLAMNNRAYALFTRRETAAVLLARDEPGDRAHAAEMLDEIVDEMKQCGFEGFLARAEALRGQAIGSPTAASELQRDGAVWLATFGGRTVHIPDSKGVGDLAALLAHPGREVAAVDLAGAVVAGDTGALLDERARREVRERVIDLEEDLAEAEELGDPVRAERARAERDALLSELAAAVGLGGRARRGGDVRERARKTVTWRVRHAIKAISTVHPELARHLDQTVRTGTFCVYAPDPLVTWRVRHTPEAEA